MLAAAYFTDGPGPIRTADLTLIRRLPGGAEHRSLSQKPRQDARSANVPLPRGATVPGSLDTHLDTLLTTTSAGFGQRGSSSGEELQSTLARRLMSAETTSLANGASIPPNAASTTV